MDHSMLLATADYTPPEAKLKELRQEMAEALYPTETVYLSGSGKKGVKATHDLEWAQIGNYGHYTAALFFVLQQAFISLIRYTYSTGSSVGYPSSYQYGNLVRDLAKATKIPDEAHAESGIFVDSSAEQQSEGASFLIQKEGDTWALHSLLSASYTDGLTNKTNRLPATMGQPKSGEGAEASNKILGQLIKDFQQLFTDFFGPNWRSSRKTANHTSTHRAGATDFLKMTSSLNTMAKSLPVVTEALAQWKLAAKQAQPAEKRWGVGFIRRPVVTLKNNEFQDIDVLELMSSSVSYSMVFYLSDGLVRYLTQSPKGAVPLSSLQSWFSIYLTTYYACGIDYNEIPPYVMPLSKAQKKFGEGSEWSGSARIKCNTDNITVTNNGAIEFVPPSDPQAVIEFDALSNEEIAASMEEGIPFRPGYITDEDELNVVRNQEQKAARRERRIRIRSASSIPLITNWDMGLQMFAGGSTAVYDSSLVGYVAADDRVLSDFLSQGLNQMSTFFGLAPKEKNQMAAFEAATAFFEIIGTTYAMAAAAELVPHKDLAKQLSELAGKERIYETGSAGYTLQAFSSIAAAKGNERFVDSRIESFASSFRAAGSRFSLECKSGKLITSYAVKAGMQFEDATDLPMYLPVLESVEITELNRASEHYVALTALFEMARQLAPLFLQNPTDTMRKIAMIYEKAPAWVTMSRVNVPVVLTFGKYAAIADQIHASAKKDFEATKVQETDKITELSQVSERMKALAGTVKGASLFPHQAETINVLDRTALDPATMPAVYTNAAIVDVDPGGGKTIILLADVINMMTKGFVKRPVLVAPNTLTMNWKQDLDMITAQGYNCIVLVTKSWNAWGRDKIKTLLENAPTNTILVVGMNWLQGEETQEIFGTAVVPVYPRIELLRSAYKPDYIGVDESHMLKNENAKRSLAALRLMSVQTVRFIRLASGTIVTDNPSDLVGQMKLIQPYVFGTKSDFEAEYKVDAVTWAKGAGPAVRQRLNKFCTVVTKKRREWAFMLPEPVEVLLPVPMPSEDDFAALYEAILDESLQELKASNPALYAALIAADDGEEPDPSIAADLEAALYTYLQRLEQFLIDPDNDPLALAAKKKLPPSPKIFHPKHGLIARLTEHFALANPDNPKANKVLVFCRYNRTMQACYDALPPKLKKRAGTYSGTDKSNLEPFNDPDSGMDILICIEMSIFTGKNLQIASRIIRMESPWTPGDLNQAISRVMRPTPPKEDEKTGEWIPHKFKRERIFLDWIFMTGTLEVAKLGRIFSKIAIKAQFDYYGEPGYRELPELELVRMSLDNIRNFRTLADLGANSKGGADEGTYLDAYQKIQVLELKDYHEKKKTELSEMVPIPPTPPLKGAVVLPFAMPEINANSGAATTKPPLGDIATIIEKAVASKGKTKTDKKIKLEVNTKADKVKKESIKEQKPDTKPVKPGEKPKKVPVEVPIKIQPGTGDKKKVVVSPNVEKNGEVYAFHCIMGSVHMLFVEETEQDFTAKDAKALGFHYVPEYVAAYMPNAKRLKDTIESLKAAKVLMRPADVEKIMEYVDAFQKNKLVVKTAQSIKVRHFFTEPRLSLPPDAQKKGLRVYPMLEDGDLYLYADLTKQPMAKLLARRGKLPGSAAVWEAQPAFWAFGGKNVAEVKAKLKQLEKKFNITNRDEIDL